MSTSNAHRALILCGAVLLAAAAGVYALKRREPPVPLPKPPGAADQRQGAGPKSAPAEPSIDDGLQPEDWAVLTRRHVPWIQFHADDLDGRRDASGLRFKKLPRSGIVYLTNKHTLFGDFSGRVEFVIPARRPNQDSGPAVPLFGLRSAVGSWIISLATLTEGPEPIEHAVTFRREADSVTLAIEGQSREFQYDLRKLAGQTLIDEHGNQLATACHFFLGFDHAEVLIKHVELNRPPEPPPEVPLVNEFLGPRKRLPTLFGPRDPGPDEQRLELPGTLVDLDVGANGRTLALLLAPKALSEPSDRDERDETHEPREILLVDVAKRRESARAAVAGGRVVLAAGRDELFVAAGRRLTRWRLSPLEQEQSAPDPIGVEIVGLACGSDANGPLLAAGGDGRLALMDGATLQELPREVKTVRGPPQADPRPQLRASADGGLFAVTTRTRGHRVEHDERELRLTAFPPGRVLVPGPMGRRIFGINGSDEPPRMGERKLPSVHGPFCFELFADFANQGRQHRSAPADLLLFVRGKHEMIGELEELDLTVPGVLTVPANRELPLWDAPGPALDRRVLLIPELQTLVTVPYQNDRLVFYHLDPQQMVDAARRIEPESDSAPPPR